MKYLSHIFSRTLLALVAGATLTSAAHAETFYYSVKGVIGPGGDGIDQYQVAYPLSYRAQVLNGAYTAIDAGASFSFTIGLDNGGNSSLGQIWTKSNVKSMRFDIPTSSGHDWSLTFLFGGSGGLDTKILEYRRYHVQHRCHRSGERRVLYPEFPDKPQVRQLYPHG
jgi:hypothetical protein